MKACELDTLPIFLLNKKRVTHMYMEDIMQYEKPSIMDSALVNGSKCGGGPCGRPKDGSRQKKAEAVEKGKISGNSGEACK